MTASPQNRQKSERLEVRINTKQKRLYMKAAELRGVSLSSLVVAEMEKAAARIIREHEIIKLSQNDQTAFAQALLNPPKPSKKLIKAAKLQKKHVESR